MYKINLAGTGFTMYVRCFKFDSDQESLECFERAEAELRNVSVWRTTTPDWDPWFVVVCGREGQEVDWSVFDQGVEIEMPETAAKPFLMRRLKLVTDAIANGDPELHQRSHYEEGVRISLEGEPEDV